MTLTALDRLVLTVRDLEVTCRFYETVLGMQAITFVDNRRALRFGQQKINLHIAGAEYAPHAARPTPGSADLCFLTDTPVDVFAAHLQRLDIEIVEGPVTRTGAVTQIRSIYLRDPDGNLLEIANPVNVDSEASTTSY